MYAIMRGVSRCTPAPALILVEGRGGIAAEEQRTAPAAGIIESS